MAPTSDPFDFGAQPGTVFGSLRIIEDRHMEEAAEDWSEVRSPSRAARRRRRGHRQRIRFIMRPKPDVYRMGDALIMHPDTARSLRLRLAEQAHASSERADHGR